MKGKNKSILALGVAFCAAGIAAVVSAGIVNGSAEAGSVKTATTIEFNGYSTGVYAFEHYAGFDGTYWILDSAASTVTTGAAGRQLGSGAGDGRDATITLSVDSYATVDTVLRIYAKFYDGNSRAEITVNGANIAGAAGTTVDLKADYTNVTNVALPTVIPVSLVEGVNTISIDLQAGYDAWLEGFEFGDTLLIDSETETTIAVHQARAYQNSPEVQANSWGGAFKDKKEKSAEYSLEIKTAGDYKITLGVLAGNQDENYGQLLVDGVAIHDEDYVSFALNGWTTPSDNVFTTNFTAGTHTLTVKAYNPGYEQSITDGTNSWCNLWVQKLSLKKMQPKELVLDTTNAKLIYNPYEVVDVSGVTAKLADSENSTEADVTEYLTFEKPALDIKGSYTVTAKYIENDKEYVAGYSVTVGGELTAKTGTEIVYRGETTGRLPLYGKEAYVGYSSSAVDADGIAWLGNPLSEPYTNAYEVGNGGENRQLDMTFTVQAASAEKVRFYLYGKMTYNETTNVSVAVNGTEIYDGSAKAAATDDAGAVFALDLTAGENVITVAFGKGYIAWLKGFEIAPVPAAVLTLDKTNVKTEYGYFESLDLTGLTATVEYNGETKQLAYADLTIDSSAFDNVAENTYPIAVSYRVEEGVTATAELSVKVGGYGYDKEAQSFDYTGTETGMMPFFSADSKAGLSGTDGAAYWVLPLSAERAELYSCVYEIGSSASDDRKLTLTISFVSTVKGKAKLVLYGKFYADATSSVKLSLNDDDTMYTLYSEMQTDENGRTYAALTVDVVEGENVAVLSFPTGYDAWLQAFTIGAVQTEPTPPQSSDSGDENSSSSGTGTSSVPGTSDQTSSDGSDGKGNTGCGSAFGVGGIGILAMLTVLGGTALCLKKKNK